MTVYKQDYEAAKSMLWAEETVEVTATQRQVGPGGSVITPTTILATDKRVIIINRATYGFRKDIESIPYNRITSVRFEKGIISSSVFLRIEGYTEGREGALAGGKQWGEIDGLRHDDAKALTDYINKMLSEARSMPYQGGDGGEHGGAQAEGAPAGGFSGGAAIYCTKCGTKNDLASKFCSNCGNKLSK